jgi:hypothetical protein
MASARSGGGCRMCRLAGYVLGLIVLAGCARMQIEDRCTYVREVKTSYQCDAGKVDHMRIIAPAAPD